MDPDQAQGRVLDQRVGINGIERKGGTYTVTPVNITVDRAVSLVGLDGEDSKAGVYTVKDDAGTQFFLLTSASLAAGTHSLSFRAETLGAVLVSLGTITAAVTRYGRAMGDPDRPQDVGGDAMARSGAADYGPVRPTAPQVPTRDACT